MKETRGGAGKPKSPEHKLALSIARKKWCAENPTLGGRSGRKNTPEHNAAISKANSHPQSPEHVAKRLAATRATWAAKREAKNNAPTS